MTSVILHAFYYVKWRSPNLYEAPQKSRKYKQIETHPDDVEYLMNERKRADRSEFWLHCLHMMTSVASGDLGRLTHSIFFFENQAKLKLKSQYQTTWKLHAANM